MSSGKVTLVFTEELEDQRWEKGARVYLRLSCGPEPNRAGTFEVVEVVERPIVERTYTLQYVPAAPDLDLNNLNHLNEIANAPTAVDCGRVRSSSEEGA